MTALGLALVVVLWFGYARGQASVGAARVDRRNPIGPVFVSGGRPRGGRRIVLAVALLPLVVACGAGHGSGRDAYPADGAGPADGIDGDHPVVDGRTGDSGDRAPGPDASADAARSDGPGAEATDGAAADVPEARSPEVVVDAGLPDAPRGDTAAKDAPDGLQAETMADAETATDPRFAALVAAFEAEWEAFGRPGAALAVVENGVVTFARGYGLKDPAGDDPVRPSTLFRIGSVTKMMTAVAVLQPAAAGAFDAPAAYQTLVPEFDVAADPAAASAITVHELLTHTHGIVDYLEVDAPPDEQSDAALDDYVTGRLGDTLYFLVPPGTFYNYSNPGYFLLGLLVERQSGLPYPQAMHERVFAPLGMTRTFFAAADVLADGDFAWGRTVAQPDLGIPAAVGPADYDNPWGRPAGYAWSGVADMARFLAFLMAGDPQVLPDAERLALMSPQVVTREVGDLLAYGYGIGVMDGVVLRDGFHALRWVDHTGGIPGFAAEVAAVPEQNIGLVVLAATDGAYFAQSVAAWFESLVTLPPTSPLPDIGPDESRYPAYAGRYVDPYDIGEIHITHAEATLRFEAPLLDAAGVPYDPVLVPTARDNFLLVVDGEPLAISFLQDETGAFHYLRSRPVVAFREDAKQGGASRPADFDPAAWRRRVHESAQRERFWLATPRAPGRVAAAGH